MSGENIFQIPWLDEILKIVIYFIAAWLVSIFSYRFIRRFIRFERLTPRGRQLRPERKKTIHSLVAGLISLSAFVSASLLSVGLFVETDTLVWMVGLFSAAFGFGARPLISDYLSGISFIFEDTFAVGDKIELPGAQPVEGVIEKISLRATILRAPSGEMYIVPNGEIRTVRNFSRGKFSPANIIIKIASSDLNQVLPFLDALGHEAVDLLPNLLEPWQIISEDGVIGQETELTLIAKAKFGKASEMRPRLLALVQERLTEENILLVN